MAREAAAIATPLADVVTTADFQSAGMPGAGRGADVEGELAGVEFGVMPAEGRFLDAETPFRNVVMSMNEAA